MKTAMKARLEAIQNKGRHLYLAGGTATVLALSGPASAAVDPTAVTTEISANSSNIETVGAAILVVLAVIAGVSLLRRVIR